MPLLGLLLVPHSLFVIPPSLDRVPDSLGLVSPLVLLRGHSMVHGCVLEVLGGLSMVIGHAFGTDHSLLRGRFVPRGGVPDDPMQTKGPAAADELGCGWDMGSSNFTKHH
ncbi:hypothetical protein [Polyangium sp. y55x31]|uniref:hypothetical protein n=1 Tax=Polyangium sp. y55x31 TaxID=3042688 RepID=UPI002482D63E|nr:hypothetical protein [Polyangium sp. y55x31]MDI1482028.1 hypothetical protein [Polyangium sp. y55x31]